MGVTSGWVGWLLGGIVLLLLFMAGAILKKPTHLLITGARARGVVVGMDRDGTLQSPTVEFVTSTGERVGVTGRLYSATPSVAVGDTVTVAYNRAYPRSAQLLLWKEFTAAAFVLGFTALFLLGWVSAILVSGDSSFYDPLRLLPAAIARFRLDPVRFPVFFVLSLVIPACGIGTFATSRGARDLRANGIRAGGHVVGFERVTSQLQDRSTARGVHPLVTYVDTAGTEHTIRGSLASPLSRLKAGDAVEVVYHASRPDEAVLNRWYELYPVPIFFGAMFLAFIAMYGLLLGGFILPRQGP
jgi:hypothetical protein